jgi:aminoglycoside phosphotransferase (APT) family kinase protein
MHADEVPIDLALVRELLAVQAPGWAALPLVQVRAWGTDHAIFRLGERLAVRLPKIGWAAGAGATEQRELPLLAPHLPVAVAVPVLVGEPQRGYPYRWCVSPWLPGSTPSPATDLALLARDLAGVVLALRDVDPGPGPAAGPGQRGGPLGAADGAVRRSAEQLRGTADVDRLLGAWQAGVQAEQEREPGRWVHGDLLDGNLLVEDGRLTGVIDWGSCAVGDPAVDLMAAWSLFDGPSRTVFRQHLGLDGRAGEAMWLRGRAWAVSAALLALPYYERTNPDIVRRSWRTVEAVLSESKP